MVDPAVLLERSGVTPDPWQYGLLGTAGRHDVLALCARQIGKTESLSVLAAHRLAYVPGTVVGIIAPTFRQSSKLLRRVRRQLAAVDDVARPVNDAATTLHLSNGSSAEAWPGNSPDNIRGDTLNLLLVDEAAWVSDEAWTAVQPMLTMSRGTVLAASTPGGPSGWFHTAWTQQDDGWRRILAPATECPRYTETDLERARRALGDAAFAVEFMCEWRDAADQVFSSADIARILGRSPDAEDAADDERPEPLVSSLSDLLGDLRAGTRVPA